MTRKKWTVTGIDVGTTKICSTIAEVDGENLRIIGSGSVPSKGLKKGVVVNLSETIDSIKKSLDRAEKQAKTVVESAYVSVGGAHITSLNGSGQTEVRGKGGEVTPEDVSRAVDAATEMELPEGNEIIHVLTQSFSLDGHNGIVSPLGLRGRQLSVNLHLVMNATAVVSNIVNAVHKAGVVVNGVVMQQLASAEAVLSSDEKELGAVLVDIGGGTTDVAVYNRGAIWHSEVLPVGGSLITKDVAIGLKAPLTEAEQLKIEFGSVFPEAVPDEEIIEVSEVGTDRRRPLTRRLLAQIVQARCDELLKALATVPRKVGLRPDLITGVVLTGGGALLDGLAERAEQIFNMPVRLGYPINVTSPYDPMHHPRYSTALGLLKYVQNIHAGRTGREATRVLSARPKLTAERVKNWLFERIG